MNNYDVFAEYYDDFMDFKDTFIKFINNFLSSYDVKINSILEIACGTGKNLEYFSNLEYVYGLDKSEKMIEIAKKNIPKGIFFNSDMTSFKININFDLIICMFDSINHLLEFSQWEKVFLNVSNHLKEGGYFIFDINTTFALNFFKRKHTTMRERNDNYMIMQFYNCDIYKAVWDLSFFIHTDNNHYILKKEKIFEKSYPKKIIVNSLKRYFRTVDVCTEELNESKKNDFRTYFICKK